MHSDCCTGMHCRYIKYWIVAFIQGAAGSSSGVDRAQCNSANLTDRMAGSSRRDLIALFLLLMAGTSYELPRPSVSDAPVLRAEIVRILG